MQAGCAWAGTKSLRCASRLLAIRLDFRPTVAWPIVYRQRRVRGRPMRFLFGDCALDLHRRELARGAEVVAVGPQVFDLLVHLVRNHERVVTKDELLDTVWHGRTVSESTLNSHINAARKAI